MKFLEIEPVTERSWHLQYGLTVVCLAAAWAMRAALGPWLGNHMPLSMFLPVVVLAAWFGGIGPGLLALVAGAILADLFFIPPLHGLGGFTTGSYIQLCNYFVASAFILAVIHRLTRTRRQAEAMAVQAQKDAARLREEIAARQGVQAELTQAAKNLEQAVQERTASFRAEIVQRQQAEKELRSAAQYARSLLEASLDPLVTIDAQGKITDVNQATESFTGIDREHLVGTSFSIYFTEPERAETVYQMALEKGYVRNFPLTMRHRLGRRKEVLYNATAYRNETGAIQGVLASARDVSEQKVMERVLQESEARYRSLVSASAQMVWTTNAQGEVLADMPTWRAFTGQSVEECRGWGWLQAIHPEDRLQSQTCWRRAVETHTPYHKECRVRRQDGQYFLFTVRAVPVLEADGRIREWVGACTDITEAKAADKRQEVFKTLLQLFAHKTDMQEYLQAVVDVIRDWTGAECAGIRLLEEQGEIVYAAARGFAAEFLQVEDHLSIKTTTCCCCRVLSGNFEDQDRPILTRGGSYRVDNTLQFVQTLSPEKQARYRGNCVKFGFSSVAVIPIRYRGESRGAIHLADTRPARFPLAAVEFLETMASLIGEALSRFRAEAELVEYRARLEEQVRHRTRQLESANVRLREEITERQKAEETLRTQNQRLELLSESAGHLLSAKDPEGMVLRLFEKVQSQLGLDAYFNFMVNEAGDALCLDSCTGIPEQAAQSIQRLDFGQAVCGTVAQLKQPITATHIQQSDDPKVQLVRRFGIRAYACNPLMAGDRLLGTLSFATRHRDEYTEDDLQFLRTICHYVAIAKERVAYTRELEQRVEERTAQLRETIAELEAFSYTISHDLRAPLRTIRGFAGILLQDIGPSLDLQERQHLERILAGAERMDRMIRDILEYSRVSRAKIIMLPVNVLKLVQGLVESNPAFQAPQADLKMETELPLVLASEPLLTQCFTNLLGNAVKYVAPGSTPRIRLRAEPAPDSPNNPQSLGNSFVRLWVEDSGIGIPPDALEHIFGLFERAHKNYEGTGIGLSIVRRAVERMGGKVGVESEVGQGSRFWIELKRAS